MSFQPVIPLQGIAGWRFLERTQETQQAAFDKGPQMAREIAYFEENIGKVTSTAELMGDRRLLKVALGAFGLEQDIDKKAWIRKILDEGTADPKALAARLADKSYAKLSDAFGFGAEGGPRTGLPGFAREITDAYRVRSFEVAVGESNNDMRLALSFRREIADLANQGETGGSWYTVLGSKPLRKVIETAFGLPTQFGQIDIDRQRDILREKSSAMFGTADLTAFRDPENVDKLIDRFLAISQIRNGPSASVGASPALTLLQSANGGGSQGLFNLLTAAR
jgi:hypothetical protein